MESADPGVEFDTPCNPGLKTRGRRIRMRLAARAPPPPILELGVRCSWLHSAACKFSIEIRAVPGGFGDLQILLQKTWKVSKMMPKSFKFHPKSTTMHQKSTKMTSGTLRVGSWKHVGFRNVKTSHRLTFFGGPLVPLERFWAPFGAQLGAKGGSKIALFR